MTVSFFCRECGLDQEREGERIKTSLAEFFRARCRKCEATLVRYISEREKDPYFRYSLKVKRERAEFAKDLLQPGEDGFKLYYKDEYDKIEKAKEDHENEMKRKKEERDAYYKKFKHNISERQVVKRVLELEENG